MADLETRPVRLQDDEVLCCPACGGVCLHHDGLDWYERAMEDAARGLRVCLRGTVTVDANADQAQSPSLRRHGFVVGFWCETCGPLDAVLALVQHKGQTFLDWRLTPVEPVGEGP